MRHNHPITAASGALLLILNYACSPTTASDTPEVLAETGTFSLSAGAPQVLQVTPLTVPGNVPMGLASRVDRDSDGSIFVSDFASTNAIYQFARTGAYRSSHTVKELTQLPEPGQTLIDFDVVGQDVFLLLPRSVWRWSPTEASASASVPLRGQARQLFQHAGHVCVLTTEGIQCFQRGLAEVSAPTHESDPRYVRYAYAPMRPAGAAGAYTAIAEPYSPTLHLYNSNGPTSVRLVLPNAEEPPTFDALWNTNVLTERTRRRIRTSVRRFEKIFGLPDGRFVALDLRRDPKIKQWWLIDPDSENALREDLAPRHIEIGPYRLSLLDFVVGTSTDGLIIQTGDRATTNAVALYLNLDPTTLPCQGEMQCLFDLALRTSSETEVGR